MLIKIIHILYYHERFHVLRCGSNEKSKILVIFAFEHISF